MDNYIARQPILSYDKKLFGYELLYRDGGVNAFSGQISGDVATRTVISNALLNFDLDTLTNGRKAFVNFTRQLLLDGTPMALDPEQFVIEILEDVELDTPLIMMLKKYKDAGYTLALDDYTGTRLPYEVQGLLDIIKVDFLETSREQQQRIVREQKGRDICLLAEKVEDEADFHSAVSMGYQLFQGYFFSCPVVLRRDTISMSSVTYLKLAKEVSRPEISFARLAEIIHPDAKATYLLVKKMRTVRYYRGHTVTSITQALLRMGVDEVRRWVCLLLLQNVIGKDMDELIRISLIRAVFCECLCSRLEPLLQQGYFL